MKPGWFLTTKLFDTNLDSESAILLLLVVGLVFLTWLVYRKAYLNVPEGQVAVIYDVRKGSSASFKPAGRYVLHPGNHRLAGYIPISSTMAKGVCKGSTLDGYEIELEWTMRYRVDPGSIDTALQPSMAKILLSDAQKMAELHTISRLEKIVGRYTLEELWLEGLHNKVNPKSTRLAADYLAAYGIILEAFEISDFKWSNAAGRIHSRIKYTPRSGNVEISRLAVLRPDLLNPPKTKIPSARILDAVPVGYDMQEIVFNDSMTPVLSQNTEARSDRSFSKLVI